VRQWLKSLQAQDRKIIGEDIKEAINKDIKDVEFSWADWHAAGALAWPRTVGSPKQLAPRPYRPRDFLHRERLNGASAWLPKENAENT